MSRLEGECADFGGADLFQTPERGTRVSRRSRKHVLRDPRGQFQAPERGTRVSRRSLHLVTEFEGVGFKPLNGEPGCRDEGEVERVLRAIFVSNP